MSVDKRTRAALLVVVLAVVFAAAVGATVDVVVSTHDGFVVAADSRITSIDGAKTRIQSDSGEKIKQVGSHVAVAFAGRAFLRDPEGRRRSIGSLIDEYKTTALLGDTGRTTPQEVLAGLDSTLSELYNGPYKEENIVGVGLELVICGYDTSGDRFGFYLEFPFRCEANPDELCGRQSRTFGPSSSSARCLGQTDGWHRLVAGYNPKLRSYEVLKDTTILVVDSLDTTLVDTLTEKTQVNLREFRSEIDYDLMTLQDAIDFAVFVIRATIELQRFSSESIQGVGGQIDVAVITREGFRWIDRKALHGEPRR